MILKAYNKVLQKIFRNKDIQYDVLDFINNLTDKGFCISEIDNHGISHNLCPYNSNIIIGDKSCINCKHCYGCTFKILSTYKQTTNITCFINCSRCYNAFYRFIFNIVRIYKKLTNTLIKYKVIFIN